MTKAEGRVGCKKERRQELPTILEHGTTTHLQSFDRLEGLLLTPLDDNLSHILLELLANLVVLVPVDVANALDPLGRHLGPRHLVSSRLDRLLDPAPRNAVLFRRRLQPILLLERRDPPILLLLLGDMQLLQRVLDQASLLSLHERAERLLGTLNRSIQHSPRSALQWQHRHLQLVEQLRTRHLARLDEDELPFRSPRVTHRLILLGLDGDRIPLGEVSRRESMLAHDDGEDGSGGEGEGEDKDDGPAAWGRSGRDDEGDGAVGEGVEGEGEGAGGGERGGECCGGDVDVRGGDDGAETDVEDEGDDFGRRVFGGRGLVSWTNGSEENEGGVEGEEGRVAACESGGGEGEGLERGEGEVGGGGLEGGE